MDTRLSIQLSAVWRLSLILFLIYCTILLTIFQCPPCRAFTPELIYTYEKLKADGKKFEVVFVSSDRSEEWYQQYASTMPWPSVPYADATRLQMLKTSFGVDGRLSFLLVGWLFGI